ncbi:segregation and condensation protein A [Enterovirga rhinocerotis]|uniref:Segregation and condensation protein A n=1 Tax=Enterovirga rhinocerotis TaxID=1339210 RepID=A0A4V3DZ12_9HYPH|nr:ScpA family protein [Enterovirga rhinocerotis]TDR94719.1 condensin subunit ScpA [Enterovirga rhinocerotis]
MAKEIPFEEDRQERASADPTLVVDVGGFEGPLDLLLDLARRQKVDLHEISVLALAEQYLAFIEDARAMRLELAADYLVMAAWLAYLKSRLLLPEPPKPEGPSAEDLATALAFRLRRLEAIRQAAKLLGERAQLGREIFARGEAEPPVSTNAPIRYEGNLYDLLAAYAARRQRHLGARVTVARRAVWTLAEAREALERLVGWASDWVELDSFLLRYQAEPQMRSTVLASALSAALEMVREGKASIRQDAPFAPLMMKRGEPALRLVAP